MSLHALPTISENVLRDYIATNYTGSYSVSRAFTVEDYTLPLILVSAGQFRQYEPGTHLYEGLCSVSVATQIDDVSDPVTTHDNTVAEVYDLLANRTGLLGAVNATGTRFHLHNYEITSFDQSVNGNGSDGRALMSVIEMQLHCQTKELA